MLLFSGENQLLRFPSHEIGEILMWFLCSRSWIQLFNDLFWMGIVTVQIITLIFFKHEKNIEIQMSDFISLIFIASSVEYTLAI